MTVFLCRVDDLEQGEIKRIELDDGRALALYCLEGEFFATDDLCTHGDAMLSDGYIEDGNVVCPYHMGMFCIRTGEATGAPCSVSVQTYPVFVSEGELHTTL